MLFLIADADGWKSLTSSLPNPQVITVTLTATDPGGLSASVSGDFSIEWGLYPEVVSARADGAAIELTFDWEVEANPAPKPWQFTVNVVNEDGSTGTVEVNSVSVDGKVVTLELASALDGSQTVTLDYNGYNYLTGTPLQRAGGGDNAPSFSGQAVEILRPPGEPQNLALSATPGSLDISATWDALDGATSYKLRWRQSGGEFEAANAATAADTSATITAPDYGEWEVRLQGCNDAGCGPEVSRDGGRRPWLVLNPSKDFSISVEQGNLDLSAKWDEVEGSTFYRLRWRQPGGEFTDANTTTVTDTEATFTVSTYGEWEARLQACNQAGCVPDASQSVDEAPEVRLSMEAVREDQGQSRASALAETSGLGPIDSKAFYTVGWHWAGADAPAPSQPDTSRQRSAAAGTSGATGQGANGATDTTPPMLLRGEIDGDTTTVYFSEDLDENYRGGHFRMTVSHGNGWVNFTVTPSSVSIDGNKVTLVGVLDWGPRINRVPVGSGVSVYYYTHDTYARNDRWLRDLAGNVVSTPHRSPSGAFPTTQTIRLRNLTQPPLLESATVHLDRLALTFDEKLKQNSVPAADAFTVTVNGSEVSLASVGPVTVSGNTVTLVLAAAVASTDAVTVSYTKPSRNPLRGVDGAVRSFSSSPTNLVGGRPSVSGVELTSDAGDDDIYALGDTIQVTATFSEAVDVDTTGGKPRLKIKMAPTSGEKWADYSGGSGTTTLTFDYTVVKGDISTDGVAVLTNTLELNGGLIRSTATQTDALLGHVGLAHNSEHKVDWQLGAPGVTGVAISSDAGDDDIYALGDTIQVTATFSEAMDVDTTNGTPRLKIKMAPTWGEFWVDYSGGSGTTTLTFDYTVVKPNTSPGGIAVLANTLELNGGTIRSTATQTDARLGHAGLGHNTDHKVDWQQGAPRVTGVAISSDPGDDDSYTLGDTIRVTATFGEAVDVDTTGGTPRLKIRMGPTYGEKWADYSGGSGTTKLTFDYSVVEPNSSPGGIAVLANTLKLNGGTIRSTATQKEARLGHVGLDHNPEHKVDWQRGEPESPTVTGVAISSDPGDDDIYAFDDTISVTATFSEAVDVDTTGGKPRLKIKMAPTYGEKWADYSGGSGTTALTFDYTVVKPNTSTGGIAVLANTLQLNGGGIQSADTSVAAYLAHAGLGHDPTHKVDGVVPTPQNAAVDGTILTMTFDEAPLDENSVPDASAFVAKVDGSTVSLASVDPVTVSGATVILTLANPASHTGTDVEISYTKPSSATASKLKNLVGKEVPSFIYDPPPTLVRAEADGAVVTQFYSEALDKSAVPGTNAFRVNLVQELGLFHPAGVAIEDNTVVLDLGDMRAVADEIVQTSYTRPTGLTAIKLRDVAGNEVRSTEPLYADNLTQP